ncbi:Cys regulon transcriptional activator CysB [Halorhodospira halochloris]|uniref:Cys regulon transcriptional activator CysB n=1 Tax=Halorhodospira halochloris TaxID=1052 RepID=A0A110B4R1_HALHR|nr:HTH-type transcriptional regulator CysB [Halorhodospira halochloris]MBK1650894.1 transcriptional regulator CysB [Halorhodospira halochloris]BAU56603.2 Cys regulon transcriptional activator CysB [Halorhodospira halochloris]
MRLKQLRYIHEIVRHNLNISAASEALYTSQSGISKQIRMLEDELGVELFIRSGKSLAKLTPAGEKVLEAIIRLLEEERNIRAIAADYAAEERGHLSIATTQTQAKHALPAVIRKFRQRYPEVTLQMHQGTPLQIAELAARGQVDLAIATEGIEHFEDLVMMPCYRWNRSVVVPHDHPLAHQETLTLEDLNAYPLVTYLFGFTGRSRLDEAFQAAGLAPQVVFTATDAEVIKTYVSLGLGVGIIARMSFDPDQDHGLVALDASHLFAPSTTNLGFRRGSHLRSFIYEFIQLFAPHLTPEVVDQAINARTSQESESLHNALEARL